MARMSREEFIDAAIIAGFATAVGGTRYDEMVADAYRLADARDHAYAGDRTHFTDDCRSLLTFITTQPSGGWVGSRATLIDVASCGRTRAARALNVLIAAKLVIVGRGGIMATPDGRAALAAAESTEL